MISFGFQSRAFRSESLSDEKRMLDLDNPAVSLVSLHDCMRPQSVKLSKNWYPLLYNYVQKDWLGVQQLAEQQAAFPRVDASWTMELQLQHSWALRQYFPPKRKITYQLMQVIHLLLVCHQSLSCERVHQACLGATMYYRSALMIVYDARSAHHFQHLWFW